jgi:lipoprotein-anchoring transpeptidase ErfK/SrfK
MNPSRPDDSLVSVGAPARRRYKLNRGGAPGMRDIQHSAMARTHTTLALIATLTACASARTPSQDQDATVTPEAAIAREAPADASPVDASSVDTSVATDAPAQGAGLRIVALRSWTPTRRAPRRDGELAGYLRAGSVAVTESGPWGSDGCPRPRDGEGAGGWYRVEGGAYLCVGGLNAAFEPVRDFRGSTPPDLDASMPFRYAISYGRSNMYRRIPTAEDLRLYEPWRFRVAEADASTDDASAAPVVVRDAGPRDAARPRLDELEGDPTSPLIRRMVTGMYVALDRSVRNAARGERYWLTQSGGLVIDSRLSVVRDAPTYQGVELDATHALPMAWMVSELGWTYTVTPQNRVTRAARSPRLTAVGLADAPPLVVGPRTFLRTVDGGAVFAGNVRRATVRTPPEGVGADEKWIDVDLDEQVLVAYEGARPVFATLISSGRRTSRNAPERFETPAGSFRVQAKHVSTTMDGDTATDGPYSIEDVPWVMYFQGSYALHAAFWHGYYGWRMSHGCVNLSPPDARRIFLWAEPRLPSGWHGVNADAAHPGTRVEIRHSHDNVGVEAGRPAGAASAVTR